MRCPEIREADEVAGEVADKDVINAGIGAPQAVEHYEIARYGALIAWAKNRCHEDNIRVVPFSTIRVAANRFALGRSNAPRRPSAAFS